MDVTEGLSASLEDYLEAIFLIESKKRVVRVKDIAKRLNVNSASVTGAMHSLSKKGLVNYTPYEVITLKKKGKTIAKEVIRRHETLKDFFVKVLLADRIISDKAACEIEHVIPRSIMDRLIKFVEFIEKCPLVGAKWVDRFNYFCEHGDKSNCELCFTEFAEDARCKIKEQN